MRYDWLDWLAGAGFFVAGGLAGITADEVRRTQAAHHAAVVATAGVPDAAAAAPSHDRVLLAPGDAFLTVVRSAGPGTVAVGDLCYATWGAKVERLGSDPRLGTLVRTLAKGRPTGSSDCAPGALAFVEDASRWATLAFVEAHEKEMGEANDRRTAEMVAAADRMAP